MSVNRAVRPTHADVARLASVSTATVSYVLNNVEGARISAETREAVYRAAKLLGYRPNLAARNLARGKSGVVLYVVPHVAVGEMPMQAGSRMTTELARQGLLQVQIFETEDGQHVVDAVENLDPVAVTSLFPISRAAQSAVTAGGMPYIEIGSLPGLGCPHLSVGEMRVDHLVERGHRRIAFAYTGIAKWRTLGDYWFEGVARAARMHDLPPLAVCEVTLDNAAEVVKGWVNDGVTAVCAQSEEIACLRPQRHSRSGAALSRRPRRDRCGRQSHGRLEQPTADHGAVRSGCGRRRCDCCPLRTIGVPGPTLARVDRCRPPHRAVLDLATCWTWLG